MMLFYRAEKGILRPKGIEGGLGAEMIELFFRNLADSLPTQVRMTHLLLA